MLRWVARQYMTGLRGGSLEKNQRFVVFFWIPYLLILMPAASGAYDSVMEACCYYALAIPMGVCFCMAFINPVRMPKLMYLCPLDKSMRRDYIRGACWFRIAVHTGLAVIGALISLPFGNDWLGALGSAFTSFLFSILCIDMDGLGAPRNTADGCVEHMGRTMVHFLGMVLVFILEEIFISAAQSGGLLAQERWEQIVISIMTAVTLLLSIRYMLYLREMQEEKCLKL
ncbi:MAG: hypothetical protein ACI4FX_08740 [Agathobacter sp.]